MPLMQPATPPRRPRMQPPKPLKKPRTRPKLPRNSFPAPQGAAPIKVHNGFHCELFYLPQENQDHAAKRDPVPAEGIEGMVLDIPQQPLHRNKGNDGCDDACE